MPVPVKKKKRKKKREKTTNDSSSILYFMNGIFVSCSFLVKFFFFLKYCIQEEGAPLFFPILIIFCNNLFV